MQVSAESPEELAKSWGMARISSALQKFGLKVGGSLAERATRLHTVQSKGINSIPDKWLSKAVKKLMATGASRREALSTVQQEGTAPKPVAKGAKCLPVQQPRCPSPVIDGESIKKAHAFDSDPLDCAETSPAAYEDIASILTALSHQLGKTQDAV